MVGWIVHSGVNRLLDLAYKTWHMGSLILLPQMVTELLIQVKKKTHYSSNGCH